MQPSSPLIFGCADTSALAGSTTYAMPSSPVSVTGGCLAREPNSRRTESRPLSLPTGFALGSLSTTAQMACTLGRGPERFSYSFPSAFSKKTRSSSSHGANEGVTKKTARFCFGRSNGWTGSILSTKCSGFCRVEYMLVQGCRYTHGSSDRGRYDDSAVDWDDVAVFELWGDEITQLP